MDQLSTIRSRDIRHDKVFHCLVFRVVIIISTPRKAYADSPVDFAVGTVDALDDVVGDQNITVVNRHVPFNGVPL